MAGGILLWREYSLAFASQWTESAGLNKILGTTEALRTYLREISTLFQPLHGRQHFIVLHSPSLDAAAWDLESKFSEAALGSIQVADYRNFAHGRHHWI